MGVIAVRKPTTPDDVWKVARWAFRWLLRSAASECGDDDALRFVFEQAAALDGLQLDQLEPHLGRAAHRVLLRVASAAAAGELPPVEVEGRVLDQTSQEQFRRAASELVDLLRRADGAEPCDG